MKNKIKRIFLGMVLSLTILGGSLTVVAAGCLNGNHNFYVVSKVDEGEPTINSYHKHIDRARNIEYSCTTYKQKVRITQYCPDCESILTLYDYRFYHVAN